MPHPERRFDEVAVRDAQSAADLVGYLNYIHPYRVQILGKREVAYLSDASPEDQRPPHLAHRHAGAAGAGGGRRPKLRPKSCVSMCERARDPAVRDGGIGRPS